MQSHGERPQEHCVFRIQLQNYLRWYSHDGGSVDFTKILGYLYCSISRLLLRDPRRVRVISGLCTVCGNVELARIVRYCAHSVVCLSC